MKRYASAVVFLICFSGAAAAQDDRSLKEFTDYLSEKLPQTTEEQRDQIAEAVDQNSDGTIDATEFEARMEFVGRVLGRGGPGRPSGPPKPIVTADYLDRDPATVPALHPGSDAELLLIAPDELVDAWLDFARWKIQQGITTKIVTVREIARGYEAESIQEKIRLCVREHIESHGTTSVLLGGDSEPGGGLVPGGHYTFHEEEPMGIPTDLVYLSPTNWDADGDQLYGEWEDDREAITYPDGSVGLGRVPVRTADDVAAFTEKVIAYESRYPEDSFASNMLYTSTDDQSTAKVLASWDRYIEPTWSGKVSRFFASQTPWDRDGESGSYPLSDENLLELFNEGAAGKLHIHGHGLLDRWILEDSELNVSELSSLDNVDAYPLITTVSCNTGEFDSSQDPSIVEQMIRAPRAGTVAIVAPVRTGKMHFHDSSEFEEMERDGKLDGTTLTMTRYWTHGLSGEVRTGQALMLAKRDLIPEAEKSPSYHLGICELNLLGDPTLRFRVKAPRTPELKVHEKITGRAISLRVETDAPGAQVSAWMGPELLEVATADPDGEVRLALRESGSGTLVVTVSGAALNTVQAMVQRGGSPAEIVPASGVAEGASVSNDDTYTSAEFQEYLKGKLQSLDDETAEEIARKVDKNGDGTIDAAEFEQRMESVQQVLGAGGGAGAGERPSSPPEDSASSVIRVGEKAPNIVGVDVEGNAFELEDYRGKVILLDFWGFW